MTAHDDPATLRTRAEEFLEGWASAPVVLCNRRLDVLASTALAVSLSPGFAPGTNLVRFAFLGPAEQREHPRWAEMATVTAGMLRESVDEHDHDRGAERIIGELSTRSREFAEVWARTELEGRVTGSIRFDETAAGAIGLSFTLLHLPGDADDLLIAFAPVDQASRTALAALRAAVSGAPEA
ncbi:hypothetical protein VD659_13425 [Herbiconiux sp. 11R-BC]|uniref:MmyB family transcriptional regulator n=1 Tax=Herbiconiux sp. 11R-BC TaxID=3111637 RepID=UPI003C04F819